MRDPYVAPVDLVSHKLLTRKIIPALFCNFSVRALILKCSAARSCRNLRNVDRTLADDKPLHRRLRHPASSNRSLLATANAWALKGAVGDREWDAPAAIHCRILDRELRQMGPVQGIDARGRRAARELADRIAPSMAVPIVQRADRPVARVCSSACTACNPGIDRIDCGDTVSAETAPNLQNMGAKLAKGLYSDAVDLRTGKAWCSGCDANRHQARKYADEQRAS